MPLLTYNEFAAASQVGGSIREDLMDFIENLSPSDSPLYSNLSQVSVNAGYVEYLEDTLPAAAANAWPEGATATDPLLATPTRNASIVQNFQRHFAVSGRQMAVRHAGMASMLSYQEMKQGKILKTEIELALTRGSAVSGDTNVAPNFKGFLNFSTNISNHSGASLTETYFNNLLELTYSFNANVREVYSNVHLKRTMNGFSTNVTKYIAASEKRMVNPIDIYDSEFGTMALIKSRYHLQGATPSASGPQASLIAIDPDYFNVGFLRQFTTKELGITGDKRQFFIVGECTLIRRSERAGVYALGLRPTIG